MRNALLLIAVCWFSLGTALAQTGKLQGKVTDATTKEEIPFASVVVKLKGAQKGGAAANISGEYSISPLNPGTYDVEVSFVGYNKKIIQGVSVNSDATRYLNVELSETSVQTSTVEMVVYKVPIIDKDNTTTQGVMTKEQIQKLPTRETASMVQTQAGVFASDDRAQVNVKGTRESSTQYYINGVKQIGTSAPNLPTSSIEQMTVITGGVPAQYGDAVGGIINITTQGPSSKFFGGVEAETSSPIDDYNNNLGAFSLSGPIWKKKSSDTLNALNTDRTIIGFFLSGQYQYSKDISPSAAENWEIKDEAKQRIMTTPFYLEENTGFIRPTAETITKDDLVRVKARSNVAEKRYSLNSSFDFQPSRNTTVTLGGSFDRRDRNAYSQGNSVFNFQNNPQVLNQDWNAYLRFTQRFQGDENDSTGLIFRNAYYQLQVDFTKQYQKQQDEKLKDNVWKYGYLGKYDYTASTNRWIHDTDTLKAANGTDSLIYNVPIVINGVSYDSIQTNNAPTTGLNYDKSTFFYDPTGNYNPELAGFATSYFNFISQSSDPFTSVGSLLSSDAIGNGNNPQRAGGAHSVFSHLGTRTNLYQIIENDQARVSALGSVEINSHSLKLGFEFEQRVQTSYGLSPMTLWNLSRSLANRHLGSLKQTDPLGNLNLATGEQIGTDNSGNPIFQFENNVIEGNVGSFNTKIREQLGLGMGDYVNVDALTPDQLSLDLFSGDELQRGGIIAYQGFDYLGKRHAWGGSKPAFRDYFLGSDSLKRPVDAFRPIYSAAFIEDKFAIDDLILRVGVRVDRYDANQQVLKDKYLTVDPETVGELGDNLKNFKNFSQLSGYQEDWVVYVDKDAGAGGPVSNYNVVGFRSGDQFYSVNGIALDNPANIATLSNGDYRPYFVPTDDKNEGFLSIGRKLSMSAFKDYEPQINVMPRLSFSFPISEDALFFAHYDILTQRPERNGIRPSDYYFLEGQVGAQLNNPDLKPQKKIDYQLGFQQRLSQASGLTISAFYSELRDLIQARSITGGYPATYVTFDNADFGTVKGMSLEYDFRRTANLQFDASYTLQFAQGTGSSATTGISTASIGGAQLRQPIPLDYDQRHAIKINLDYRFRTGEGMIGGKPWLQNFGLNFNMYAGSGTPYTRQRNITQDARVGVQQRSITQGNPNGSRLPGNVRFNARIDKDFALQFKKPQLDAEGKPVGQVKQPKTINVYLRVQNLLNSKNVLRVYRYTGSPTDDAYLSQVYSLDRNNIRSLSEYDLYSIRLQNPANFSLPRRAYIGLTYSF